MHTLTNYMAYAHAKTIYAYAKTVYTHAKMIYGYVKMAYAHAKVIYGRVKMTYAHAFIAHTHAKITKPLPIMANTWDLSFFSGNNDLQPGRCRFFAVIMIYMWEMAFLSGMWSKTN